MKIMQALYWASFFSEWVKIQDLAVYPFLQLLFHFMSLCKNSILFLNCESLKQPLYITVLFYWKNSMANAQTWQFVDSVGR